MSKPLPNGDYLSDSKNYNQYLRAGDWLLNGALEVKRVKATVNQVEAGFSIPDSAVKVIRQTKFETPTARQLKKFWDDGTVPSGWVLLENGKKLYSKRCYREYKKQSVLEDVVSKTGARSKIVELALSVKDINAMAKFFVEAWNNEKELVKELFYKDGQAGAELQSVLWTAFLLECSLNEVVEAGVMATPEERRAI